MRSTWGSRQLGGGRVDLALSGKVPIYISLPNSCFTGLPDNMRFLFLFLVPTTTMGLRAVSSGLGEPIFGPDPNLIADYALLAGDNIKPLPPDFTICSSVSSAALLTALSFFQLLLANGKPWMNLYAVAGGTNKTITLIELLVDGDTTTLGEIPLLPQQWSWLHACVALVAEENHITVVANGKKVADRKFTGLQGLEPPSSLVGKLLLAKMYPVYGIWYQHRGVVANLNIFSGAMTLEEMVARTAGEKCGKEDGDVLGWGTSQWELFGDASFAEVTTEDLCRRESDILVFTEKVPNSIDCTHHCQKLHTTGRMASVETPQLFGGLTARLEEVSSDVVWVPITKADEVWVDSVSKNPLVEPSWLPGTPDDLAIKMCGALSWPNGGFVNWPCQDWQTGGFYCPCQFSQQPYLTMRGLCKDSYIDQDFLPQNHPADGRITFYGTIKTNISRAGNQWNLKMAHYKTTAKTDAAASSFMLGKHSWTISNDSEKCHKDESYTAELKLTGCKVGEFTCNDGQCVRMEERCDQVADCRDESDEDGCRVIIFKNNYNKNVPPIGKRRAANENADPVKVLISITLMKVVEIEEVDHSIHLQFQISMQWKEPRVVFQNLKKDTTLNALSFADKSDIWLPLVVYDNTDQKLTSRLGMSWEWITTVAVTREEENPERSGLAVIDEAEYFQGAKNRLTMNQTYTMEFQCQYKLQRYPFDTQVLKTPLSFHFLISHRSV